MGLLGLFGGGGLLNSQDPQGLLGSRLDPNMPLLMTGLGMLGSGYGGGLTGLQAGMKQQNERRGVTDWETLLKGYGGSPAAASSPGLLGTGGIGTPAGASSLPPGVAARQAASGTTGQIPAQYAPMVQQAAAQYGLDPNLFGRQLQQESGWNPNAVSPAGAQGIAQFMPATAQRFGIDPTKPDQAIPASAKYTAINRDKFGGNLGLGLAGYNWGEGNVQKWMSAGADPARMPAETRDYVQKITGRPIESWTGTSGGATATGQPAAAVQPVAIQSGGAPTSVAQNWLAGLAPEKRQALARIAANNPTVAAAFVSRMMGLDKDTATTDDIKEFTFARQQGYAGSFPDFLGLKRAATASQGTDDEREYNLAVKQGFKGSLLDYFKEKQNRTTEGDKAPAGYRWNTDRTSLDAIPGGPATKLEGDQAGRMALAEMSLGNLDNVRKIFTRPWTRTEQAQAQIGAGEIGRAQRDIRGAIEATLRMLTGAAATEGEVRRLEDAFMPKSTDAKETVNQKIDNLIAFIGRAMQNYRQGRGENPLPAPQVPGAAATPVQPATPTAPLPSAQSAPPAAADLGADAETVLQQARNAIAAGAPRAAVEDRLKRAGIDPGKL